MPTLAGPEIGVASTKAFTCQLAAGLPRRRRRPGARQPERADEHNLVRAFVEVPRLMAEALALERDRRARARSRQGQRRTLSRARHEYPLALEGALKLKEISYIHAEGYAAGEMKHGPIALIDETMPMIVIAPYDRVFDKTVSNMQEVAARGGAHHPVTDKKGAAARPA